MHPDFPKKLIGDVRQACVKYYLQPGADKRRLEFTQKGWNIVLRILRFQTKLLDEESIHLLWYKTQQSVSVRKQTRQALSIFFPEQITSTTDDLVAQVAGSPFSKRPDLR